MLRTSVILCLFLTAGCNSEVVPPIYHSHKFDQQVIEKIPLYDSLASVLLQYYSSMDEQISEGKAYRYTASADSTVLSKIFPEEGVARIKKYFLQLGKEFIYGFDVYKDSSIKIYIRDTFSNEHNLYIRHRMSFLPDGGNFQKRELPVKDTILNKNWQYWVRFDEPSGFFN